MLDGDEYPAALRQVLGVHGWKHVEDDYDLLPDVADFAPCRALAVVIVPQWPSQLWWVEAMSMTVRKIELLRVCFHTGSAHFFSTHPPIMSPTHLFPCPPTRARAVV